MAKCGLLLCIKGPEVKLIIQLSHNAQVEWRYASTSHLHFRAGSCFADPNICLAGLASFNLLHSIHYVNLTEFTVTSYNLTPFNPV